MMAQNSVASWYCIHTRSRHENVVHNRLIEKGLNSFLPKMEVWSKRKDRKKKIHKVLFPGYLFVNDCLNHYKSLEILKTPGVVRILGNEQGPVPVPEAQIESIMRILDRGVVMNPIPYLKEGQLVRVVDGPLQGCEGFLSEVKEDKERLIISVDILKRSVAVEIEATSVEPV